MSESSAALNAALILSEDDALFWSHWPALTDQERTAIGQAGFQRFRQITAHVQATEEKFRSAQVRDIRTASTAMQSIADGEIDFRAYEMREEQSRVIPAESLAEEGKRRMLLGHDAVVGLTLPWDKANDRVKMLPGKLAVWAGWSHHGKSQMLKQIMLHAITLGEKVCIASMEEDMREVWEDMGCMACGGPSPTAREIDRWIEFQTGTLWFYDQQGTVDAKKIRAVIRYCAEEKKITQFVIDSLMMLAVNRDDFDAQAVFVGDLKALAKDTGCTVHLVCHMRKRDGKTGEEQPGNPHDISGGHEIFSKADYAFNVWRDKKRKNPLDPECILSVDKQRGRSNWIGKLSLDFHAGARQFIDGKWPMKFWGEKQREPGEDDE